ncbi:hypothetical protein Lal_00016445 [Lupinus albus]|uniref:Uncharacterized protein n=1 Tax=Lupinus albus TaxID=3870 RepID=A0A6A5MI49_LUPAL|nr:hypothetical protein Lalb_Chr05g0223161 [Lupinus albus]KAF1872609.1 hypothetical protein Lal_00016445 [Lupinus albus]
MEIEPNQPVVAKKLWNIVRVLFFMFRKGIAKSKILVDFNMLLKRGKLAGKALVNNLMLHHHHFAAAFACRHHDTNLSFISPREYEFSCSNSPTIPFHTIKRKHHYSNRLSKSCQYDDVSTLSAVQRVLEMLNNEKVEASPMVNLPGFGKSPIVKQLRVTDSPFPLKDDGDSQVDLEAEEFIKRFYKDLNLQKRMAIESPYHSFWGR